MQAMCIDTELMLRRSYKLSSLMAERYFWSALHCWKIVSDYRWGVEHRSFTFPLGVWVRDRGGQVALDDCRVEMDEQLPLYFLQLQLRWGFMMMVMFKVLILTVSWRSKKMQPIHLVMICPLMCNSLQKMVLYYFLYTWNPKCFM